MPGAAGSRWRRREIPRQTRKGRHGHQREKNVEKPGKIYGKSLENRKISGKSLENRENLWKICGNMLKDDEIFWVNDRKCLVNVLIIPEHMGKCHVNDVLLFQMLTAISNQTWKYIAKVRLFQIWWPSILVLWNYPDDLSWFMAMQGYALINFDHHTINVIDIYPDWSVCSLHDFAKIYPKSMWRNAINSTLFPSAI